MGKIVCLTCGKCGGTGLIDDHYDSDKQEWITRWCPECSGTGTIHMYQCDDDTYSDSW